MARTPSTRAFAATAAPSSRLPRRLQKPLLPLHQQPFLCLWRARQAPLLRKGPCAVVRLTWTSAGLASCWTAPSSWPSAATGLARFWPAASPFRSRPPRRRVTRCWGFFWSARATLRGRRRLTPACCSSRPTAAWSRKASRVCRPLCPSAAAHRPPSTSTTRSCSPKPPPALARLKPLLSTEPATQLPPLALPRLAERPLLIQTGQHPLWAACRPAPLFWEAPGRVPLRRTWIFRRRRVRR